jgi:tetratricopeptide (TPR) repeat protein
VKPFLKVFLIIVLILAFFAGVYVLSILSGPSRDIFGLTGRSSTQVIDQEAAAALIQESEDLEHAFDEIIRLRHAQPADLALMREAIELQQQANRALGGSTREGTERVQALRLKLQEQASLPLLEESERAEMEAKASEKADNSEAALAHYKMALNLQRTINEDYPLSAAADIHRMASLQRKTDNLLAEPLYQASVAAEARAEASMKKEDWDQAKEAYTEALNQQQEIASKYPETRFAMMGRLNDLQGKLASLDSSDLAHKIRDIKDRALEQKQNGNYLAYAEQLQLALRFQAQLNRDFPRSHFASTTVLENMRRQIKNAKSYGLGMEIIHDINRLNQALYRSDTLSAAEQIQWLVQKAATFRENYPESTVIDADVIGRLDFLHHIRNDLAFYQQRIQDALVPVPAHEGISMSRNEISQALYTNIMLANPSRNRGEQRPVDSITWHEAKTFCERLSWLMARPCRLPKRSEFESAVGSLRYVDLNQLAWHSANAGDRTQPVGTQQANANGFHDLLGNVTEWLEPSGLLTEQEAYLAGGSFRDSTDELATVPIIIANRLSRNASAGLRVVVEQGPLPLIEPAPLASSEN